MSGMTDVRKYVPSDMYADINQHSGFIDRRSEYHGKTVYGLFMEDSNIQFVAMMVNKYITPRTMSEEEIQGRMSLYRKIKSGEVDSESIINNPIVELSFRNREFIEELANNVKIRHRKDTPESAHQKKLLEYQNIDDTSFKEVDWGTRYGHLKDPALAGQRDVYRWGNRIPPDRVSAQKRHYDRDITDSLRDVRQLETPVSGYDMSYLKSHNSNNNFPCGEYE
jgi:hypothetical protein